MTENCQFYDLSSIHVETLGFFVSYSRMRTPILFDFGNWYFIFIKNHYSDYNEYESLIAIYERK